MKKKNLNIELLQESQKRPLDAFEKEELNDLDSKIEKALDKESQVPAILKDDKQAGELVDLLKAVDKLAEKLNKKDE